MMHVDVAEGDVVDNVATYGAYRHSHTAGVDPLEEHVFRNWIPRFHSYAVILRGKKIFEGFFSI